MAAGNRILIIVAAGSLLGAVLLVSRGLTPPPAPVVLAPPPPVATSAILVARTDLPAGVFLGEEDLTWHDRPVTALRPDFFVKGSDVSASVVGSLLTRPLRAGEPILRNDALSPRDHGFLAAELAPDKRSVSVAVDDVSGNAGLILPGDHVDVIVTRTLPASEPPARQVLGEIVAENLRVIAVDQTLRPMAEQIRAEAAGKQEARGTPAPAPGANAAPRHNSARTVSLEVTSRQAEMIVVAVALGKVTLALRGASVPEAPPVAKSETSVWAGDVMRSLALLSPIGAPHAEPAAHVVVLRGLGARQAR